jgi:TPR repeat protein
VLARIRGALAERELELADLRALRTEFHNHHKGNGELMKCEQVPIGLLVLSVAIGFSVCTCTTIAQNAAPSKEQIAALLAKANAGDVYSQVLLGQAYENDQHYSAAAIWFAKAAESGNALAQDHLAYLYDKGIGVPQDVRQAVFWLRKAAEQGDPYAQSTLGGLYREGHGVPQDDGLAVTWWRRAAAQGDLNAQKALAQSEKAAAQGDVHAQKALAQSKTLEGIEQLLGRKLTVVNPGETPSAAPFAKAKAGDTELIEKAEAGDVASQVSLASGYKDNKEYRLAAMWFRKAADLGDVQAQYRLGLLFSEGKGVAKDEKQAVTWYMGAAGQGMPEAEDCLGLDYVLGEGVPRDFDLGLRWLRAAAGQGNADAQIQLADDYAFYGLPDHLFWAQQAASKGDVQSMKELAYSYYYGSGVRQDYGQAANWFQKLADQGDLAAPEMLIKAKQELTEIEAAQKRDLQQRQLKRVFFAILVTLSTGGVLYLVFRFRHMTAAVFGRLIPRSRRMRQFIVLAVSGGWCSTCCFFQVLNPAKMAHPVNAAVTALLLAIPGLIFGTFWLWWFSHPLTETAARSPLIPESPGSAEPAAKSRGVSDTQNEMRIQQDAGILPQGPPVAATGPDTSASLVQVERIQKGPVTASPQRTVGFLWGRIQGGVILLFGLLDLLRGHPILLGNMYGNLGCLLLVATGIALLARDKAGLVLFFVCTGALLLGALSELRFGGLDLGSNVLLGIPLVWWLLPAVFYYPKRWKEFSWNQNYTFHLRTLSQTIKRTWLVFGWFVLLFLWNYFARTGPLDRPVAVHLFEAAEYFLSIFEIVLTIGVVWLIYRFTKKNGN